MDAFSLTASDGQEVACHARLPASAAAIVQIAHGMGEHARRYDRVAGELTDLGYAVYASDHRGHGLTAGPAPGHLGADGWNRNLADLFEINLELRRRHPGLKLCLVGHSMGAMLAQHYATRYGASLDALVLSGSPGFKRNRLAWLNRLVLGFEQWRLGPAGSSPLMQKALFANANKAFDGPDATGYEWLSRDSRQVSAYVADDLCGFVLSVGSLADMFQGAAISQRPSSIEKIPRHLPVYVFSGADDPVHGERKDLDRMVDAFRAQGLSRLDYRLYPGGRHEMFNETNREEVMQDLAAWLAGHLQR